MSDLSAARLRDLILDFYETHDKNRLQMGLDVFSVVNWTMQNGLDALNELLMEQYSAKIDKDKELGGVEASFKRFSILFEEDDDETEAEKRNFLYQQLVKFYEQRDPSKRKRVPDFIQYIMLHGIDKFNQKLMKKYDEGLDMSAPEWKQYFGHSGGSGRNQDAHKSLGSSFTISSETTTLQRKSPPPAPQRKAAPPARVQEEDDDDFDIPPPPPPPPDEDDDDMDIKAAPTREHLRTLLTGYYAMVEPSRLNYPEQIEAIVDWGMNIGEDNLEQKLITLYGVGFSTAKDKKTNGGVMGTLRKSISKLGAKAKPSPPKPPTPPMPPKQQAAPPTQSIRQKPTKPKPPAPIKSFAPGKPREDDVGPCMRYSLDMTGASFGVCKCGYSRAAHSKNAPQHKQAQSRAQNLAREFVRKSSISTNTRKPTSPTSHQGPLMEPNKHTGTYLFKTTSADKPSGRADVKAGGSEKGSDRVCNNFSLSLTSNSYGVCENCGFKREQHNARNQGKGVGATVKRISRKMFS